MKDTPSPAAVVLGAVFTALLFGLAIVGLIGLMRTGC